MKPSIQKILFIIFLQVISCNYVFGSQESGAFIFNDTLDQKNLYFISEANKVDSQFKMSIALFNSVEYYDHWNNLRDKQFIIAHIFAEAKIAIHKHINDNNYQMNQTRILAAVPIIIIIAFVILIYFILHVQIKRKKELLQKLHAKQQENAMRQQHTQIYNKEEITTCKQDKPYPLELKEKEQRLIYMALRQAELIRMNKSIKDKLGPFKFKLARKRDRLAFHQVMEELCRDSSRDPLSDFEAMFSQRYGDFYEKLAHINPTLTRCELQLCALIRMNLATKEIASILCLSPYTIDQRRHNVRKKLGLKSHQNLNNYFLSL